MEIREFRLGKVDGKEEFLLDGSNQDKFFDAFLVPEHISIKEFIDRERYFITGFRGTGKTSLLRYIISTLQKDRIYRKIILFKTDIVEENRARISQQVDMSIAEFDSLKMGIAQDFKSAWMWFILHNIAELMISAPNCFEKSKEAAEFIRMMGLGDQKPFKKVLGYLPKLEGTRVRISAETGLFSTDVDLSFEKEGSTTATALFSEVVSAIRMKLTKIQFNDNLVLGIDELEVFFGFEEQYRRDLSMVRDLIFSVDRINGDLRATQSRLFLIAAIRREVVDAIGVLGQEVNRVVHDRGVSLSWHHSRRSLDHPLIEMIRKKMRVSLPRNFSGDPVEKFFDQRIDGELLDSFLLDRSFYRPRDLIWRLTFAQKTFPREPYFSTKVLRETESEYSSQLWTEVEYELSTAFTKSEIKAITSIFSGIKVKFFLRELQYIAETKGRYSREVDSFLSKHSLSDLCETLYRYGALGNDFRTGTTGNVSRNRWVFRGDNLLISDQRMTLNPALRKALSAVDQRKRGTR